MYSCIFNTTQIKGMANKPTNQGSGYINRQSVRDVLVMISCVYYVKGLSNVEGLADRELRISAVKVLRVQDEMKETFVCKMLYKGGKEISVFAKHLSSFMLSSREEQHEIKNSLP